MAPGDMIGFYLRNDQLAQPISVRFRRVDQLDPEAVLAQFSHALNSNDEFIFEGQFQLQVILAFFPYGFPTLIGPHPYGIPLL